MFFGKKFATRAELLSAIEKEIKEESDDSGAVSYTVDGGLGSEISQSKRYRQRAQDAENELSELKTQLGRIQAEKEEFERLNPEKQQETIKNLVKELGTVKADKAALEKTLEPLKNQVETYQRNETRQKIEQSLTDVANQLGIRPEAIRDVKRLANALKFDPETGEVRTVDGSTPVDAFLKSELAASPHWLPTSVGGGSSPGTGPQTLSKQMLFEQAKKAGNVSEMIRNAPVLETSISKGL